MQYLNLGLPKSGLESTRKAMLALGVRTLPIGDKRNPKHKSQITWQNWLDIPNLERHDLFQGYPYSAYYKKVIATLQSLNRPLRLLYTYRPLKDWLISVERRFNEIGETNEENDLRQRFFNTLIYDKQIFTEAWEERLEICHKLPDVTIIQISNVTEDNYKWDQLQRLTEYQRPFPHANRTLIPYTPTYAKHELVA